MTAAKSSGRAATGPRGLPLLGILPALRRDPLGFLLETARAHGPVAEYRIGPRRAYLVSHPDGIRRVLQDNVRNYTKDHFIYGMLRWIVGDGLLTSQGDFWLRQRRLAQPAFHRQKLLRMAEVMLSESAERVKRWESLAEAGTTVSTAEEMMDLTLNITARTLLGSDVRVDARRLGLASTALGEHLTSRFRSLRLLPPVLPLGRDRDFRRAMRTVNEVVNRVIANRHAEGEGTGREDLLSMLMDARDEDGSQMSDLQLRDEVLTTLIAGHETTATTLTWTFAMLDANREVEARLHAELDQVLGGRSPTLADVPALPYTRAVLDETLRLYPAAYVLSRKVVEDDELCGVRVRAGSWLDLSPYATHRLAEFWPEPEAFRPQRFLGAPASERPRFAYFPFSGGPRQCIGNQFALMEGTLVLASLAQRFSIRRVGEAPLEAEPLVTLRVRGGLPAKLLPRGPSALQN